MEGLGGNQEEILSIDIFGGYRTEVKERIERSEMLALRNKVKEVEHEKNIWGGLRQEV